MADGKPDGDSIGSTTAFLCWLEREGVDAVGFSIEPIPSSLRFLDGVERMTSDPAIFSEPFDLVCTFDASDPTRCGITTLGPNLPDRADGTRPPIIVFDHHVTNPRYGTVNLVQTDACATCDVLVRFFEELGERLDHRMATSLLTGLCTDTSTFLNSGTTARGLESAAACIASGARFHDIQRHLVKNLTTERLRLWGLALARLHHDPSKDLATTYFLREDIRTPADEEAVEGMSNFLNAVCGSSGTFLVLRELENGFVKGSFRSVNRDVAALAKQLGGGGHKKAAGFKIPGKIQVIEGRPTVLPPEN